MFFKRPIFPAFARAAFFAVCTPRHGSPDAVRARDRAIMRAGCRPRGRRRGRVVVGVVNVGAGARGEGGVCIVSFFNDDDGGGGVGGGARAREPT